MKTEKSENMAASIQKLLKESGNLVDNILHGIIITDMEGQIIFWNQASEDIFGYSREQILGRSSRILYHGLQDEYSFRKVLEQFKTGNPLRKQWRGRHKNGSEVWLDVRSKILRDKDGTEIAYLASVCDVKPLKNAEELLKESQAISEAIIKASIDAIITIDEKGLILSFNKAAEKMFGYSEKDIIGERIEILIPQPHKTKHHEYLENYIETGEKKIIGIGREVNAVKKNGEVFPIDLSVAEIKWSGKRIFSGIIKDIRKRRRLERRVIEIGEDERRKIGRELHDGLGQMLTGIRMLSENLARRLKANELPGAEEVQEISDMIKETDEYARSLSHGFVHVDSDEEGLQVMLQNLCKRSEAMFKITCNCDITSSLKIHNREVALNIYRIAQEAIHNAVKHGRARSINLRLAATERHITLVVTDDGSGFNKHFNSNENNGMGIPIMKHRAHLFGGVLEFVSTEEGNTEVRCLIPKNSINF